MLFRSVAAVVGSLGTATPLLITEVIVSGVDVIVTLAEDDIASSGSEAANQFIEDWNSIAAIYGGG